MKKQLFFLFVLTLFSQSILFAQDYVLRFDGMGSRVKYVNDTSLEKLNGATDYTIEAWIMPTDEDISGKVIMKRWNSFALTLFQNDNMRVYFTHYADDGATKIFINSLYNVIILNEWNHIAVINDSAANTLKLYVNGVDVSANYPGDATSYEALTLDATPGADANFYIGYGGSGTLFNGYADKVRLKNVAVDSATLQTDINDVDYASDADTALLLYLNEGTGTTTLNEASGTNADLSCYGTDCDDLPIWYLVDNASSVADNNTISFSIYPNPVNKGVFTIQAGTNESIQTIEVLNILGQTIKTLQYDVQVNSVNINIENLASGHYLVQTKTNNGTGVKKLIIN